MLFGSRFNCCLCYNDIACLLALKAEHFQEVDCWLTLVITIVEAFAHCPNSNRDQHRNARPRLEPKYFSSSEPFLSQGKSHETMISSALPTLTSKCLTATLTGLLPNPFGNPRILVNTFAYIVTAIDDGVDA